MKKRMFGKVLGTPMGEQQVNSIILTTDLYRIFLAYKREVPAQFKNEIAHSLKIAFRST